MDDCSWMYRVSIERLCRMDYCNMVDGFINYTLSNLRNISGGDIRYPCKRCKNKKLLNPDVVTIHLLQKGFMEKYLCWFTHGEPYVPYNTMVEMTVWSTTSSSNVHEVVDDNSNRYRSMVMNKIRMNQGDTSECSIVNEELNKDVTRFFLSFERL